mmetsp:Transcript_30026/g.30478  ORF Transcript_30026/g.30478 Transcript_30026/m.30478 type:complete len:390 (+) Transcript_30026:201-1370(+)
MDYLAKSGSAEGRYHIPVESVAPPEDDGGTFKSAIPVHESLTLERPLLRPALKGRAQEPKTLRGYENFDSNFSVFIEPEKQTKANVVENALFLSTEVPMRPEVLLPHYFRAVNKIPLTFAQIQKIIESILSRNGDLSYDYLPSSCEWNVAFMRGSFSYKAQIHVYQDFEESLIVEIQRFSGDRQPFNEMYREVKNTIIGVKSHRSARVYPLPDVPALSEGEMVESLAPVVSMAKDQYLECQQSAAQVLCDLSQHEGMHNILCEAGCVEALVGLVRNGMDCTRQHAVLALANLSSSQSCQEAIISEGVLPALLSLVTNGPCSSTVMGRESARLLANLSDRLASRVFSALDAEELKLWMASVDDLNDSFLKQQAERARCALSAVIDVSTQG